MPASIPHASMANSLHAGQEEGTICLTEVQIAASNDWNSSAPEDIIGMGLGVCYPGIGMLLA